MKNLSQQHFDAANLSLTDGNIEEFSNSIIALYHSLTCNCFFKGKKQSTYLGQLKLIEHINDDGQDFHLHFAKGYLYQKLADDRKSYEHLTIAISLNPQCDVHYTLRSYIESEINQSYLEDAETAVELNRSDRNLFILANKCRDGVYSARLWWTDPALVLYEEVIQLNPSFACAYYNMGNRYAERHSYHEAIRYFLNCIEAQPDHWGAYSRVSKYLWKEPKKALKYARMGFEIHPKDFSYLFRIGDAYMWLKKYSLAIKYFEEYQEKFPNSQEAGKNIEDCKRELRHLTLLRARKFFEDENYPKALKQYEKYLRPCDLSKWDYLSDNHPDVQIRPQGCLGMYDARDYLITLFMTKDPPIDTGCESTLFVYLEKLRIKFEKKSSTGEKLSKEEENIGKLRRYGSGCQLGFGKYKGRLVSEMVDENPHYLLWCTTHLLHFSLDDDLLILDCFTKDPLYAKAVEINIAKSLLVDDYERDETPPGYHYDDYEGDWGGLYGDEAELGYWNTE